MAYDAYRKMVWSSICATVLGFVPLTANPQGATVVHGQVDIVDNGATLNVTSHKKHAVIDWKQFNIAKGELTKFSQLDKSSAILNRVTGGDPSKILGAIQSNGKVFLINPNGIVFGADSCINTSAFLASTHQLSLEQFLKSKEFTFSGDSKEAIINYGTINASGGDVYLIGRVVENHGTLSATEGTVGIGVGQEILLKPESDEHIFIKVASVDSDKLEKGLTNTGYINALKVELKVDGQPYARAIQQNGVVNALGVKEQNGRVFLVAEGGLTSVAGSITASNANQTGGEVRVLGKQVQIESTAHINVAGKNGGGSTLIGGDYMGRNEQIYNSSRTEVDPGAIIDAQATESGNGGKVIVWADQVNNFAGTVNAKGGQFSGEGGFVEVSGKLLSYQGTVDTRAANGKTGTLLLDPNNITVSNAPTSPAYTPPDYTGAGTASANLNRTDLNNQLVLTNVVISTDAATAGGSGDITFTDGPIGGPNNLTVNAFRDVNASGILFNGIGDLNLNAGRNINLTGGTNLQAANSNLNAVNDVNMSDMSNSFVLGKNLSVIAQNGNIGITNSTLVFDNITLTATTGDVNVASGSGSTLLSTFPGGTLDIDAGRDVTFVATAPGAQSVWLNPTDGVLSVTAGRDIVSTSTAANNVLISPNGSSGDATLIAGRNMVFSNGTTVVNQSPGPLTLVVDNANPSSVGAGFFQLDSGAAVSTTGGPLRVFTSAQALEVGKINGTLNGQTVPFGTPSSVCGDFREIGGVAYGDSCASNFLTGNPYTVFYKSGATPPPVPVLNNSVIYDAGKNTFFVKSWDTNFEKVAALSWWYFSNNRDGLTNEAYSQLLLNLSYFKEPSLSTLLELYTILSPNQIKLMHQTLAIKVEFGLGFGLYALPFNLLGRDASNEEVLASKEFQTYIDIANSAPDQNAGLIPLVRFIESILLDNQVGTKENRQKIANLVTSMPVSSLTILELLYLCFVRRRKKLKLAKNS